VQPDYQVKPDSLNNNANLLVELAGVLGAGLPDQELARRGCAPASPDELSKEIKAFADFATDQYQDLVAILSALSTKLRNAAGNYAGADQANAQRIDRYLHGSQYVPPGQR
jgi:hypothetical protein